MRTPQIIWCPRCQALEPAAVFATRRRSGGNGDPSCLVRRDRQCYGCGGVIETVEVIITPQHRQKLVMALASAGDNPARLYELLVYRLPPSLQANP